MRLGEKAVSSGIEHGADGVDRLVQASIDRLAPVRRVREEMSSLRSRLEQLEASLAELETAPAPTGRWAHETHSAERAPCAVGAGEKR